jgi:glycosyltransferase involved in cell wall biosynthesis
MDFDPTPHRPEALESHSRVKINGGFFAEGDATFRVRGVSYGTFAPRSDGALFPDVDQIRADFDAVQRLGFNVVRTYTLPPADLLDEAEARSLRVLVGLDFHDWRMEASADRAARRRIRDAAMKEVERTLGLVHGRSCVFGVAVGNEIPVDLVRLYGARHVEDVLGLMSDALHAGDPELLVTYANYPTTEYLSVPGLDFVTFNLFLDEPDDLRSYIQRLEVINEGMPVLVGEIGIPGYVGGEAQGKRLGRQLRAVDESGCAGAVVFSWTDDWVVNNERVAEWGFGITDADRRLKPAAKEVLDWTSRRSLAELRDEWPTMSVIVCAYNEERFIGACVSSVLASDYPDLELIVCDDGSTDRTREIVGEFPDATLVELDHGGLSRARNVGSGRASGEIVVYLDADAECHPDWPYYLAMSMKPGVAASGGPNLPFVDVGFAERVVAAAPGNPRQVLLSHDRAEHVPGCNMAFRRDVLESLGGFNPRYTSAGDDVDLCWRLIDAGHLIGYAPAAQIHHHRRDSFGRFMRQQRGYGRAERLLADVHRHRFNRLGQARWSGTLYGMTPLLPRLIRPVVYTGWHGQAPYQTVQRQRADASTGYATALVPPLVALMIVAALAAMVFPAAAVVAGIALVALAAFAVAIYASVRPSHEEPQPLKYRTAVAWLHLAQPLARAWGLLRTRSERISEHDVEWAADRAVWVGDLVRALGRRGVRTVVGPDGEHWDIRARWGLLSVADINVAVVWGWEARARSRVRPSAVAVLVLVVAIVASIWFESVELAVVAGLFGLATVVSLFVLRHRITAAVSETSPTNATLTIRTGWSL